MILRNLLTTLLIFALIGLAAVGFLYYSSRPASTNAQVKDYVVKKGATLTSVAKDLEKDGIVRSRIAFFIVAKQLGIEKKIQAGTYSLSPAKNARQIAEALTQGTEDIWVTIPEGLRREEIAAILAKNLPIKEVEFNALTKDKEGYLYPDTYLFPKQATASLVLNTMEKTLQKKFTQQLKDESIAKGWSEKEVLTLASLVEREGRTKADFLAIANILKKRLNNKWTLDIDAGLQYALGYQAAEKDWWKKSLTNEDKKINSPYNLYKTQGLPPTPIANPGIQAIEAVVKADGNTPYWFYISDKNGKLIFAETLQEQSANIEKYLR